jgi:hypothetical protein
VLLVLQGNPATLSAPLVVGGATPRAVDDANVLTTQGKLLKQLIGEEK